ncbi:hypothetical protein BJ508DRAFT_145134 [Ascobolus immersus RN42]|uniref:MYND-type zinc finger protein samB n=1 Tax=Ascobolus immersus RN42 TaxID=1160509 RepID=A0A3N4HZD9_ASCIM|nr:hypothetical protein BJ508DRAFT_145134 [Ascobolus immersus RN42]
MRQVNFSIPGVNKASVGITTALYDRRALDCTSTLPLINSLHHLAYLTASSARIRDILTVDGGVERLVCILKEGRSKDMMSMWMWNLALQCVMNIGVRGSETVRTRVVEADIVPVIATILDNYIQVIEKYRTKAQEEKKAGEAHQHKSFLERSNRSAGENGERSSRRHGAPTSIAIPPAMGQAQQALAGAEDLHRPLNPTERHRHWHHSHHSRDVVLRTHNTQPSAGTLATAMDVSDGVLRPVRAEDRLPSMLGITSQPESPMTPNAPQPPQRQPRNNQRPPTRHRRSQSAGSDSGNGEPLASENASETTENANMNIVRVEGQDSMLESVDAPMTLNAAGSEGQDGETFGITHLARSPVDGSINPAPTAPQLGFSPGTTSVPVNTIPTQQRPPVDMNVSVALPTMPREEDVLMALQILAYVSKYCNLREYFQKTHLVPALQINRDIEYLDDPEALNSQPEQEIEEEYLLPDDYNIFPLVEKFTIRHHSSQMQYWAAVVMRNLCRKDDSRGGIRQCAYYECGKWEDQPRQFAKCRRCRRTKYCSKECQKSAWVYHRHWCVAACNP